MFERLAAWTRWRPGVRARAARTSADERRLWVRYPCEFETASCSLHAGQSRLEARVRDISGGGISLITSTPLEPGSLLTIELTTDAAADSQLLAYLVRSVPQADGVWENGCIFSLELSDEELARFGAARREAGEPDQRGWVRFPSAGRATYRSARQPEQPWRDARLLDISASGLGLEVPETIEVGSLLDIRLSAADGMPELPILASVVRTAATPEARYRLGCNFLRQLTEQELATFAKSA